MNFLELILQNKLSEAKDCITERLNTLSVQYLQEAKIYVAAELNETSYTRNPNIVRMGRIHKIRRRFRRNAQGRIVLQKNSRRSTVKGYRVKGNRVVRIPTVTRLMKARKLKLSWKTSRRAKLRRSIIRRRLTMRRRQAMGLK